MLVDRIDDWDEARTLVVDSYRFVASLTSVANLDGEESSRTVQATTAGEVKPEPSRAARASHAGKAR
jgi:hypothetical protein